MSADTDSAAAYRCSPWTLAQNVDPIGSALRCDMLVLIETPPPWPRDVADIPLFAELGARVDPRTRLLAVRPAPQRDGDGVGVTIWRRTESGSFTGTDHIVARDRLSESVARHIEGPLSDPASGVAPREVLICGHGSRDTCCGRLGTRLALDAAEAWTGVRVRRCSHTGGHRFAPTGFTFPDGRSWGYLDDDVLAGIVGRQTPPPVWGHYRGNTAVDMWAQVVERELFHRLGWSWLDYRVTSSRTDVAGDGHSATVELSWANRSESGSATAVVEVVREVPILICGQPPTHAEKTSPELALRSLAIHQAAGHL